MQTSTEDYKSTIYILDECLDFVRPTYTQKPEIDMFIYFMEFLGFRREDVEKVINGEMTAREAFQNAAPPGIKNKQWILYGRRYYEFNNNVAISGDYGNVNLDEFPFPFEDEPILDCSKVNIKGAIFGDNKRGVKLINVKPDQVVNESIKRVIFDAGTPIKKAQVLSDGSTEETIIKALNDGAEEIGLFRDESVINSDREIDCEILRIIERGYCSETDPICQKVYEAIYKNTSYMYSLTGDKNIVFRLADYNKHNNNCRGAGLLIRLMPILNSEVRAIIRAAKEHHKIAKILVPYIREFADFYEIKNQIFSISEQEGYNNIEVGAMLETKEVAPPNRSLVRHADFVSIGTNDLTESVLGKKRSEDDEDFSVLNEKVKKVIADAVQTAKETKDIPIYICGEHTNYSNNLEYLLSLNIDGITIHPEFVRGFVDTLNRYYEDREDRVDSSPRKIYGQE